MKATDQKSQKHFANPGRPHMNHISNALGTTYLSTDLKLTILGQNHRSLKTTSLHKRRSLT